MGMEGMQYLAEPFVRRVLIIAAVLIVVCLAAIVILSGCADPCHGDPKNMRCMDAAELKRELGVK